MNPLSHLVESLESPLVHRLGWTLAHSLWEGAAVALLLGLVLALLKRRSPQARYLAACGAMLAMAALPVVTFHLVPAPQPKAAVALAAPQAAFAPAADPTAAIASASPRAASSADRLAT